jgi:hypothetical protein
LLLGKTTAAPERTLFWRVGKKNALRSGDWKLIRDGKPWQLYDLARDIGETTNLAPRNRPVCSSCPRYGTHGTPSRLTLCGASPRV